MRAVGYQQPRPFQDDKALVDLELPQPLPGDRDLLVRVAALSVNPVDTKVRKAMAADAGQWKVLGWDAVGVVEAVGNQVSRFSPGDRIWYAGELERSGCNAEFQCMDERLVALAPSSLSDADAAALPLTALTAWELLFDRLRLQQGSDSHRGQSLLVVGAAGGVGSILLQLARQLTGATVIATASRPESQEWVRSLGAQHVIDHHRDFRPQIEGLGFDNVQWAVSLTHTGEHFLQLVDVLAPQGALGLIDDPEPGAIDVRALKRKSLSLHWELMFTRSLFQTPDLERQGWILGRVATLVEENRLRSTLRHHLGTINASHLRKAHGLIESGTCIGKLVLEGFE